MTTNRDKLMELIGAGIHYLDRVLIPITEGLPIPEQIRILGEVVELKERGREAGTAFQDGNEAVGISLAKAFLRDCIALYTSLAHLPYHGNSGRDAYHIMRQTLAAHSPRPVSPATPVAAPLVPQTVAPSPGMPGSDALALAGLALGLAGLVMKGRK